MGNNPETDTIASVRYHCMNVQAQARIGRETEELFRMEDEPLSPGQQIRLHLRCLLQEHKFGKLAWHLSGIRRAIFPCDSAERYHRLSVVPIPPSSSVPIASNIPSCFGVYVQADKSLQPCS
jgi:hypothetical protein